jgi:hypothetical protein
MKAETHRQKAERIEHSLTVCTPSDWEIQIEAAMLAGTHWANYALHRRGVTVDGEDIVHTTMTILAYLRKYQLAEEEILGALAEIEELRPLYVRGDVPGGTEAGARALALLSIIRDRARCL